MNPFHFILLPLSLYPFSSTNLSRECSPLFSINILSSVSIGHLLIVDTMPPADRSNGHPQPPPGATITELGARVRKVLSKCQKAGVPPEQVAALSVASKIVASCCSSNSVSGRYWYSKAAKKLAAGALGLLGLGLLFWLSGAAQSQRVAGTWLAYWGSDVQDEKVYSHKF